MTIAFIIGCLLVHVILHEAAHAYAMRRDGIRITTAGLGLPIWPTLRVRQRNITWTLSPWLLGAYVTPDPASFQRMETTADYRRTALHYNAGVLVNLVMGLAAMGVALWFGDQSIVGLVLLALAGLGAAYPGITTAYVLPALAWPALAFLGYALTRAVAANEPVGYAGMGDLAAVPGMISLTTFGLVALGLATLNAIPVYPLDNGRVWNRIVRRAWGERWASRFRRVGTVAVLTLVGYTLISDTLHVIF